MGCYISTLNVRESSAVMDVALNIGFEYTGSADEMFQRKYERKMYGFPLKNLRDLWSRVIDENSVSLDKVSPSMTNVFCFPFHQKEVKPEVSMRSW
nr:hypothetical protein [Tanacetum cinerariifolium]